MEKKPFDGINFLEFTWAGVGAFTGNFLTYYGATTIRVESASRPDPIRLDGPAGLNRDLQPRKEGGPSKYPRLESGPTYHITHPVYKYDITLNMKTPGGVDVFKRLVAWADVVVENFTTGVMERLGLGYEELKKIKPGIIMHRTNGYGHTGTMAAQPGLGMTVTALTGMHGIAGWPGKPPVPVSSFYTDHLAPLFGALALISAINNMRRTGKGQCIDHSQIEAGINYMTPVVLDYTVNKRELSLKGNKSDYAAPHGAYPCKGDDRWVTIGVFTDKEWESFCRVIENPAWTKETRFSTLAGRVENSDDLDRLVGEWTINFTAEQVMAMMQSAGVASGVVANARDQAEDPQFKHYDFFREREHPYLGKHNFYHPPAFKLSKAPAAVSAPSLLGEHTEYICRDILGMAEEEFNKLKQGGVFD
jgi:benzylsuccinate CoA-transferase BbsF subunit